MHARAHVTVTINVFSFFQSEIMNTQQGHVTMTYSMLAHFMRSCDPSVKVHGMSHKKSSPSVDQYIAEINHLINRIWYKSAVNLNFNAADFKSN